MNKITANRILSPFPLLTLGFTLLTTLLYPLFGKASQLFIYNRDFIAQGEIWRIVSGHFVHCDIAHLGWNLAAFFILASILEQRIGKKLLPVIMTSSLGVSAWLWFAKTDLVLYCGLSGMLNGLLAIALFLLWQESKNPLLPLTALGALAKIAIEAATGQSLFTDISWQSVPGAHGAGMTAGIAYLFFQWMNQDVLYTSFEHEKVIQ